MQKLWLVRHGQTNWNVSRKIQGWTDIPLNDTGRAQARRLQTFLSGIPFHKVFSSDLQRATETARILAANQSETIEIFSDLRERYFGQGEGTVRTDFSETFFDSIPDAETTAQVMARGAHFLDYLVNNYPDGRYLCVSHGGMIRSILLNIGTRQIPTLSNTGITVLENHGKFWKATSINWQLHLEKPADTGLIVETGLLNKVKV